MKYGLEQTRAARETNVLFIDGGSFAQRGIDARLLAIELERYGYSVRPVQLALGATNHFERYQLYEDLLARLGTAPHPGQRWILMAETNFLYDNQPLAQFAGNQDTIRALHYLTPANALAALAAQQDPSLQPPSEGPWRWNLLRHVLINAFNVGVTDRLIALDELGSARGSVPGGRRRLRGPLSMKAQLREIKNPTPDPKPARWLRRQRERRLLRLWGDRLDELVYFGVPSTLAPQLKHARGFCRATRHKCISPDDASLLSSLDAKGYWVDKDHLNRKGARAYTVWLAARLVELQVLSK